MEIPEAFVKRLYEELPGFADSMIAALLEPPHATSIRLNKHKATGLPLQKHQAIPWADEAFWLHERPVFTLDPAFHAGAYYVQESSSMLLSAILKRLPAARMAIDISAAPGGKTTILADALHHDGWLLANEIIPKRAEILKANMDRWGNSRVVVSNTSAAHLAATGLQADLLLLDVPCSGEGMFRKDPDSRQHWHAALSEQCSVLQSQIMNEALPLLQPGGYLIYSTCTFSCAENEQQWHRLQQHGLIPFRLDLPSEWGFVDAHEVDRTVPTGHAYHAFPGTSKGEGFFIAVFQTPGSNEKPSKWADKEEMPLPLEIRNVVHYDSQLMHVRSPKGMWYVGNRNQLEWCERVEKRLPLLRWGTALGEIPKGRPWLPAHALALATDIQLNMPQVQLQATLALWYLARKDFQLNEVPEGNFLVKYGEHTLGWGYKMKGKLLNCYPANEKIRMLAQQAVKVLDE
ncbi:MAG: hypothetical protein C0424_01110 [Sphingobacteriaceae bacterium]|nr:hypothetical protein [Sphingobacteriaceae bacterium]